MCLPSWRHQLPGTPSGFLDVGPGSCCEVFPSGAQRGFPNQIGYLFQTEFGRTCLERGRPMRTIKPGFG
jgi:hypothetical protein